jgi:hypothetical protein
MMQVPVPQHLGSSFIQFSLEAWFITMVFDSQRNLQTEPGLWVSNESKHSSSEKQNFQV